MVEPKQKLAVVLQTASTGGWRYLIRLLEGIRSQRHDLDIACYLGWPVLATFAEDRPRERLEALRVGVRDWPDLPEAPPANKFRPVRKWRYEKAHRDYHRWINHFNEYDAVFFAWPYGLACPDLSTRLFFIPHDFNYLHFMGAFNMAPADAQRQKAWHAEWLTRGQPIVSTQFIADEIKRGFPGHATKPHVIPLARLSDQCRLDETAAKQIVSRLEFRLTTS